MEITIYRPHDTRVDWFYESAPKRIGFANDTKKSRRRKLCGNKRFRRKSSWLNSASSGVSATELSQYVYIDIFNPEGRGNWSQPDEDGEFEIPCSGEYELTIWVDSELKGYGSPKPRILHVGKNTLELPNPISLVTRDKTLTGKITTDTTGKDCKCRGLGLE